MELRFTRLGMVPLSMCALLVTACANPDDSADESAGTSLKGAESLHEDSSVAAAQGQDDDAQTSSPEPTEPAETQNRDTGDDEADAGKEDHTQETEPVEEVGIPSEWLSQTSEAWPESAGFGAEMPVLTRSSNCLLAESLPEMFEYTAAITDVGFGPQGSHLEAEDAYRYLCNIWSRGNYSGRLQLVVPGSASEARALSENFQDQPNSDVQQNTVETVTFGGEEFHVLTRWYPGPEHGMYEALFFDPGRSALVMLEINSLDQDTWEESSAENIAEYLVAILTADQ